MKRRGFLAGIAAGIAAAFGIKLSNAGESITVGGGFNLKVDVQPDREFADCLRRDLSEQLNGFYADVQRDVEQIIAHRVKQIQEQS